jgi:Na+/H+ antiporter NhaA
MNLNPEFQRQLYLECSPARLMGIPMVLGIIFTLSFFIDNHNLGSATANTDCGPGILNAYQH